MLACLLEYLGVAARTFMKYRDLAAHNFKENTFVLTSYLVIAYLFTLDRLTFLSPFVPLLSTWLAHATRACHASRLGAGTAFV